MQTHRSFKNVEVFIKTGTEGPLHDPYSYEEYSFTLKRRFRKPKEVMLHLGLLEDLEVNGKEVIPFNGEERYPRIEQYFKKKLKIDLTSFLDEVNGESYHESISKCTKCGSDNLEWKSGFPGEAFLICNDCEEIVDSVFNESEIM